MADDASDLDTSNVPEVACPGCASPIDRATGFRAVRPDDISVCIECAMVLQFDADLIARPISDEAMRTLGDHVLDQVNKLRSAIVRRQIFAVTGEPLEDRNAVPKG